MKIACGIVTYNRVDLLRRALPAALAQTRRPDRVLVIDNASTDGTADWLDAVADPAVQTVHLRENLGGAGGFAMAMDLAMAQGFDAIWVFDDDGVPAPEALAALERGLIDHRLDLAGSLVIAEDEDDLLAFGLISERRGADSAIIRGAAAARAAAGDGILPDMANPFNGVLVTAQAIRRSGNVRPEMFLWGDEIEFMRRLIREGHRVGTVVAAEHRHPRPKTTLVRTPFGLARTPPRGREVYFYRNFALNYTRHFGPVRSAMKLVRSVLEQAWLGHVANAARIPLWWLDGCLDLYRLPPGRWRALSRWRGERQRLAQGV